MRYYYNPKTNQLVKYDSVKTDSKGMTHYEIDDVKQPVISWDLFVSLFELVDKKMSKIIGATLINYAWLMKETMPCFVVLACFKYLGCEWFVFLFLVLALIGAISETKTT